MGVHAARAWHSRMNCAFEQNFILAHPDRCFAKACRKVLCTSRQIIVCALCRGGRKEALRKICRRNRIYHCAGGTGRTICRISVVPVNVLVAAQGKYSTHQMQATAQTPLKIVDLTEGEIKGIKTHLAHERTVQETAMFSVASSRSKKR